jgi:osmotically-inducible protein OsmY
MGKLLSALLGVGVGALAMLLLDPARGNARRARLANQTAATARRAWRGAARRQRMLASAAAGKLSALRAAGATLSIDAERPNDPTLKDRVESELLRDPKVPKGSININAQQGIVVLRGEVPSAALRSRLEKMAGEVRGVWYVENLLHLPGEPAPTAR